MPDEITYLQPNEIRQHKYLFGGHLQYLSCQETRQFPSGWSLLLARQADAALVSCLEGWD